jgi:uncharacterized phosphosugar-binding protein
MIAAVQRFRQEVDALLRRIAAEEQDAIARAASLMADVVAGDHLIFVFGTGGHSYIGAEEMFYRAGGLAAVYPIFDPGVSLAFGARRSTVVERLPGYAQRVLDAHPLTQQDALIIVNAYGINAVTIDAALWARAHRVPSIGVTSPAFSRGTPADHPARHPSQQNLCDLADHVIDTKMPPRDAALVLEGLEALVAPTSTILNAFALQSLVAATVELLLARGARPPIWTSANVSGGEAANLALLHRYAPRVPPL